MMNLSQSFQISVIYIFNKLTLSITDYALQFLNKESHLAGVHVAAGLPDLTQFTLCFWMKSNDTENRGSPFSYSVKEEDNELLIYNYKSFRLVINGQQK